LGDGICLSLDIITFCYSTLCY